MGKLRLRSCPSSEETLSGPGTAPLASCTHATLTRHAPPTSASSWCVLGELETRLHRFKQIRCDEKQIRTCEPKLNRPMYHLHFPLSPSLRSLQVGAEHPRGPSGPWPGLRQESLGPGLWDRNRALQPGPRYWGSEGEGTCFFEPAKLCLALWLRNPMPCGLPQVSACPLLCPSCHTDPYLHLCNCDSFCFIITLLNPPTLQGHRPTQTNPVPCLPPLNSHSIC